MFKSLYQILYLDKISLGEQCSLIVKHKTWTNERFHISGTYNTPNQTIYAYGWKTSGGLYSTPYIQMVNVDEEWIKEL